MIHARAGQRSVIRVLAVDHFFDQDLRALATDRHMEIRRIPYRLLRRPALRFLGDSVATGLEAAADPDLGAAQQRYKQWLTRELRRLHTERPFDVVVLPSDTLFYVRALPDAAHRLGVPVAVVQKETTISPATMALHSQAVGTYAPFVSDLMTVCSARQQEFWVRSGADPARIIVTGQPRFDMLANCIPHPERSKRRVLFLSYALDAYEPGAGRGAGGRAWESLRTETEQVLVTAARSGGFDVEVKPHPQQPVSGEAARLRTLSADLWGKGFALADPQADTRQLIMAADIVVGFQTTALYEAAAARRPAIYAAWGSAFARYRKDLIPFDQGPSDCIHHAGGPDELRTLLDDAAPAPQSCLRWIEEALGPLDGGSAERVGDALAQLVHEWAGDADPRTRAQGRRGLAVPRLAQQVVKEAMLTAALPPAYLVGRHADIRERRRDATARRRMTVAALRGPPISTSNRRGPSRPPPTAS